MEKTFYMVYREGGGTPTKKHETEIDAIKEAERLISANNNVVKFFILKAVSKVERKPTPISVEALSDE